MRRTTLPTDDAKAVIFDMDGVLIDSFRCHFESWRRVAAEYGRVYTESQFVACFGRTSREVIAEQWDGGPLSPSTIREIDERKEFLFRELIDQDFPAMDGSVELVSSLADAGFRIAVGSSGPPDNVRLAVGRLGIRGCLTAIITGGDVKCGKPDPQVFTLAAERMGVAPARCVVVEDAPVGIEAARRGGMRSIGLASRGRTVEQLSSANLVVTSLKELSPARFDRLLREGS
jgi:beta-phosphoglucomutase